MDRVRAGDEQAFVALVERHRERALNIAYRYLGDRAAAEDLAQEAFVRVYERRASFRPGSEFTPWFHRILTNLCLDRLRRHDRRDDHLELLTEEDGQPEARTPEAISPPREAERGELARRVRAALMSLPERQRLAVILQHYEGLSYDAIAAALGCSRGTVDGLLSRARASLRDRLQEFLED